DGPLRPEVEAAIRRLNAPVRLCGFLNQSAIPDAYAAADALVLCSEGETWGLVVNEAMAAGLPAVVTDRVGCADDLVRDGETGYVFPCGAVPALAAILGRCAADPPALNRLGKAARGLVADYSVARAAEGALEALRFCRTGARPAVRTPGCSLPSLS